MLTSILNTAAEDSPSGFRMLPAILTMLIFLAFFGAMLYVLVASF
ncbi:hypothetical protein [Flaviaesturariibacter amylovorans]